MTIHKQIAEPMTPDSEHNALADRPRLRKNGWRWTPAQCAEAGRHIAERSAETFRAALRKGMPS